MGRIIGFDAEKYLEEQSSYILERVNRFDKFYVEFGGKLAGDYHAMRVLPGFDPDAKLKLLHKLKDHTEIIICIYAKDIEKNKIRGDYGYTYDEEVFNLIGTFREWDLSVNSVVITRYTGESAADIFIHKLRNAGIQVYTHSYTEGYPLDVATIVSPAGYGKNTYIPTSKRLVVVTAPGANSGKLGTCLSQLYHEKIQGQISGYAKFETFPIWNLPLKHPVNVAYEAATADIGDINMIDPYHLEAYGESAVNYNRDIEQFPLLQRILKEIFGEDIPYKSPTEMGVNRVGFCITDENVVMAASKQEIIRRSFQLDCDYKRGLVPIEVSQRGKMLMHSMQLTEEDRIVVKVARARRNELLENQEIKHNKSDISNIEVTAIELPDGSIVTGKASALMTSLSACLLNATKALAGLRDALHLISPLILEPVQKLKEDVFMDRQKPLDAKEILLALSISSATNPMAEAAFNKLSKLRACQAHATAIPSKSDEEVCLRLGLEITYDPVYSSLASFM